MLGGPESVRDVFHRQSFHFDTEDTGPAYTHRCKFNTARGPLDPLTTAVLDQPPGRAAKRLAPPGRLKRDLNKAHLLTAQHTPSFRKAQAVQYRLGFGP